MRPADAALIAGACFETGADKSGYTAERPHQRRSGYQQFDTESALRIGNGPEGSCVARVLQYGSCRERSPNESSATKVAR
jgi:hypothetical protein